MGFMVQLGVACGLGPLPAGCCRRNLDHLPGLDRPDPDKTEHIAKSALFLFCFKTVILLLRYSATAIYDFLDCLPSTHRTDALSGLSLR